MNQHIPIYRLLDTPLPIMAKGQIASQPIKHIFRYRLANLPKFPFSNRAQNIVQPLPSKQYEVNEFSVLFNKGNIVYNCQRRPISLDNQSFGKKTVGLLDIQTLKQGGQLQKSNDIFHQCQTHTLIFDSKFQSGNLELASIQNQGVYNLIMRKDINSNGHTQWFFFKAESLQKKQIQFRIFNFSKKQSMFNKGMQPVVMSSLKKTWERGCHKVSYSPTRIQSNNIKYYCLSFSYSFEQNEQVYFCSSYPYTYSKLLQKIQKWEKQHSRIFTAKPYCKSLAGNNCYMLTLTSQDKRQKPQIIIMGRVHSGQSQSSIVCQGMIEMLLSKTKRAQLLLASYVIRIFPMINVDGVIHGNYRNSLAGVDLNRQWLFPSKKLHPQIFYLKQIILRQSLEKRIVTIVDLHGHFRKKDCFVYGCHVNQASFRSKEFAYLLSKKINTFSFSKCSFVIQKQKQGTARVTLFKQLKNPYVFTLQCSFFGSGKQRQYVPKNYLQIGQQYLQGILMYFGFDKIPKLVMKYGSSCDQEQTQQILKAFKLKIQYGKKQQKKSQGSASNPSIQNLPDYQLKELMDNQDKIPKKLRAFSSIKKKEIRLKGQSLDQIQIKSKQISIKPLNSQRKPVQQSQERVIGRQFSQIAKQACDMNYTSVIYPNVLKQCYKSRKRQNCMFDFSQLLGLRQPRPVRRYRS